MYETVTKTIRIDLNSDKDLKTYDVVLNDPSCVIVREIQEKITNKFFNDEGEMSGIEEKLVRIVTYQKKEFLEA